VIKMYKYILVILLMTCTSIEVQSEEENYEYQIALCGIFQDDARFLKEWIEFHRLVGVEHFYLFNNLSVDDYISVLSPYIEQGIVELYDWPYESNTWDEWHEVQNSAYEKGLEFARGKVKWLAILDTDEFLFAVKAKKLGNILKEFEGFGAVGVNWQLYGTSGVLRIPDDKLMIETLVKKAPSAMKKNRFVKCVVRPERVEKVLNAHQMEYKEGFYHVDENKKRFVWYTPLVSVKKLRVNHYWTRDEDFLLNVKIPRRSQDGTNLEWFMEEMEKFNQVHDPIMLRFAKELRMRVI